MLAFVLKIATDKSRDVGTGDIRRGVRKIVYVEFPYCCPTDVLIWTGSFAMIDKRRCSLRVRLLPSLLVVDTMLQKEHDLRLRGSTIPCLIGFLI